MSIFSLFFVLILFTALARGNDEPLLFDNYIEACEEPTIFRGACKVVSYGYSYHLRENKCLKVRGSGCKVYGNFYQLEKGCRLNCLE